MFLVIFGCTTKPAVQPADADPLSVLPGGENFYLLSRPAEHQELVFEILRDLLPLNPSELYPALERTTQTRISGTFGKPLQFSGFMEGRFPAYFVRRSLKKSPLWEKEEERVYRGPENILADTLYKDTLLTASDSDRLSLLQELQGAAISGEPVLPPADKEWWLSGRPALLLYIPDLSVMTLPAGMPGVPSGTALIISLIPVTEGEKQYSLSADFRFDEARSVRLWNLGLRIFLAGRLGLSVRQEERDAMTDLILKTEGSAIHLTNWNMTARGWGEFFSSFSEPF